MLRDCKIVGMLATTRPDAAKQFYSDVLGLELIEEQPFAIIYEVAGSRLHIQKVRDVSPHPFTSLGWRVPDVREAARALVARGVKFERFDGMEQDDLGMWVPPGGDRGVCWFKDPDGNLLSIS